MTKRAITECHICPSVRDNVLCINTCLASTSDSCGAAELLSPRQNNWLTFLSALSYVLLCKRQTLFMFPFVRVNSNVTDGLCFPSAELRHGKHENKIRSISNDGEALFLKDEPTFPHHGTKRWLLNFELTKKFHSPPHLNHLKGLSSPVFVKLMPPSHPQATSCGPRPRQQLHLPWGSDPLSSGK